MPAWIRNRRGEPLTFGGGEVAGAEASLGGFGAVGRAVGAAIDNADNVIRGAANLPGQPARTANLGGDVADALRDFGEVSEAQNAARRRAQQGNQFVGQGETLESADLPNFSGLVDAASALGGSGGNEFRLDDPLNLRQLDNLLSAGVAVVAIGGVLYLTGPLLNFSAEALDTVND